MIEDISIRDERDLYRTHFNDLVAESKKKEEEFEKLQRLYTQSCKDFNALQQESHKLQRRLDRMTEDAMLFRGLCETLKNTIDER